jgi:outer membrane biosynthesis protein TonB
VPPGQPNLGQQLPVPEPKLPVPPKKPVSRKPAPKSAPAPPPAPAQEPVTEPAPPVPDLEQILTPQQQQEYNQAIDRSIDRAQRNLAALGGRRLNPEQTLAVERIKTFIQQALEARKTDLLRAKSLAERADVLAEDLLRSVQ